jgi:predicted metal-binding protein
MAVVSGVGNILHAIISAVVSFFGILVSFFTCGYCGGKRRRGTTTTTRRSRI